MIAITALLIGAAGIFGQGAIYDAADAPNIRRRKEARAALANAEYTLTYRVRKDYGHSYYEYCYYVFTHEADTFCEVYKRYSDADGEISESFHNRLTNGAILRSLAKREELGYRHISLDADA